MPKSKSFKGKNLIGEDFSGQNLHGTDFLQADLRNANFAGAVLRDVNFRSSQLNSANFNSAQLTGCNIKSSNFLDASLEDVGSQSLKGFPTALPRGWSIDQGCLFGPKANLTGAVLRVGLKYAPPFVFSMEQHFHDHGVRRLDGFTFADDIKNSLVFIDLSMANFRGATLSGIMSRFEAKHANFSEAKFNQMNFFSIDFAGSDFNNSLFEHAIFHSCNLEGVNFEGSDLSGVELLQTKSTGLLGNPRKLPRGFIFKFGCILGNDVDLSHADLSGANLQDMTLRKVSLEWSNLTGANLMNTDLSGANLRGVNLSGANLTNANLSDVKWSNSSNIEGATTTGTKFLQHAAYPSDNNPDLNFTDPHEYPEEMLLNLVKGIDRVVGRPSALPPLFAFTTQRGIFTDWQFES